MSKTGIGLTARSEPFGEVGVVCSCQGVLRSMLGALCDTQGGVDGGPNADSDCSCRECNPGHMLCREYGAYMQLVLCQALGLLCQTHSRPRPALWVRGEVCSQGYCVAIQPRYCVAIQPIARQGCLCGMHRPTRQVGVATLQGLAASREACALCVCVRGPLLMQLTCTRHEAYFTG